MKSLRQLGLAVAILVVSGSALAGQGRHDPHHGRNHHHGPHHKHHQPHYQAHHQSHYYAPPSQCTVKTKVSHHGRHYKEEIRCQTPKHVHYSPRPAQVHRAPVQHVHVVHMPPPPAIVIGPHGVKVHGTVRVGW